jgi:hypothetical protein
MRRLLLVPILLLSAEALASGALFADEIRLHNGRTLEGVIVAESDASVELQLSGGTLSLAKSSVREVVRADSTYSEYLSRAAGLRRAGGSARAWAELALWAKGHSLETAAREAAREAVDIDPGLPELAPLMRDFGFELDDESGLWLPYEEVMRNRGMVPVDGNWVTPERAAEIARLREEIARERRRDLEAERLERATAEMRLAAAQMEAQRSMAWVPEPSYLEWGAPYYSWPPAYRPGSPPGIRPDPPRPERPDRGPLPAPSGGSPAGNTARGGPVAKPANSGSALPRP